MWKQCVQLPSTVGRATGGRTVKGRKRVRAPSRKEGIRTVKGRKRVRAGSRREKGVCTVKAGSG